MDSFIVSARKYRPQTFADVVGQKHITDTLINEIKSQHLAQAFLFTGPRGVGKTTCARILAKVINTNEETKPDQDFAFNIFELDAASNNSVDDIRALNEQVRMSPQTGKYKVYIIDEVHMLSLQAFNAFLKTLEEPPSHAIFILATTEKHKILPTILSRCQIFNFNRIKVNDIVAYLKDIAVKENVEIEDEALHLIAQKADGGMRDALSMFDQLVSFCEGKITYDKTIENLNLLDADYYFQITDALLAQDAGNALVIFDEILQKGFDGHQFLLGLNDHCRNLLMVKDSNTHHLIEVSENVQEKYMEQASKTDYGLLLNALNVAHKFEYEYKTTSNKRLHIELCLMKINALPYLMRGNVAQSSGEDNNETAVIMEFRNVLAIPAPVLKKRTIPKPAVQPKESGFKLSTKLIKPKDRVTLLSKEEIENIPELSPKTAKQYELPKSQEIKMVHEEDLPLAIDAAKTAQDMAFNLENVRIILDDFSEELINQGIKRSSASLIKQKEFAIDGNNLIYNFESNITKKQFDDVLLDLKRKVKSIFGNQTGIETMVTVEETEVKEVFSPSTQFAKIIAQSESVQKLIKTLGIGIKK